MNATYKSIYAQVRIEQRSFGGALFYGANALRFYGII